jgi:hypothetical protein
VDEYVIRVRQGAAPERIGPETIVRPRDPVRRRVSSGATTRRTALARRLLKPWGMTHRLDINEDGKANRISFEGVLDRAALEDVLSHARLARRNGARTVVLVLATGTEVHRECIEALIGAEGLRVEAVSPFLARWLRQCGVE